MKPADTPKRARVLAAIDVNRNAIIPRSKTALFAQLGVSKATGYRILRSNEPRTFHNANSFESRGQKPKISDKQAQDMIDYAETAGFEARAQNYHQLAASVDINTTNICTSTIKNALPHQYRKHPAALRKYVPPKLQNQRYKWALEGRA